MEQPVETIEENHGKSRTTMEKLKKTMEQWVKTVETSAKIVENHGAVTTVGNPILKNKIWKTDEPCKWKILAAKTKDGSLGDPKKTAPVNKC